MNYLPTARMSEEEETQVATFKNRINELVIHDDNEAWSAAYDDLKSRMLGIENPILASYAGVSTAEEEAVKRQFDEMINLITRNAVREGRTPADNEWPRLFTIALDTTTIPTLGSPAPPDTSPGARTSGRRA